jgi:DNA-binding response OmpR family regulator
MKNKKILIVEDDPDLLAVLKKRLEAGQYDVVEATQGYEALYKYLREKPDLILLDIMIPKLNGYEVCREIRREIKDKATPIIMLTSKGEDYDRIKGKVIGATTYHTKPFDWDELHNTIKQYLI